MRRKRYRLDYSQFDEFESFEQQCKIQNKDVHYWDCSCCWGIGPREDYRCWKNYRKTQYREKREITNHSHSFYGKHRQPVTGTGKGWGRRKRVFTYANGAQAYKNVVVISSSACFTKQEIRDIQWMFDSHYQVGETQIRVIVSNDYMWYHFEYNMARLATSISNITKTTDNKVYVYFEKPHIIWNMW